VDDDGAETADAVGDPMILVVARPLLRLVVPQERRDARRREHDEGPVLARIPAVDDRDGPAVEPVLDDAARTLGVEADRRSGQCLAVQSVEPARAWGGGDVAEAVRSGWGRPGSAERPPNSCGAMPIIAAVTEPTTPLTAMATRLSDIRRWRRGGCDG
jgi:hypothetical protein